MCSLNFKELHKHLLFPFFCRPRHSQCKKSRQFTGLPEPQQMDTSQSNLISKRNFNLYQTPKFFYQSKFNSLSNNKILGWSKLEEFVDKKINVSKNFIFVFEGIKNIVGNGQNAGYKHFFSFTHNVFKMVQMTK